MPDRSMVTVPEGDGPSLGPRGAPAPRRRVQEGPVCVTLQIDTWVTCVHARGGCEYTHV